MGVPPYNYAATQRKILLSVLRRFRNPQNHLTPCLVFKIMWYFEHITKYRPAAESYLTQRGSGYSGVKRGIYHASLPHVIENPRISAGFRHVTQLDIVNRNNLGHNKMVNGNNAFDNHNPYWRICYD